MFCLCWRVICTCWDGVLFHCWCWLKVGAVLVIRLVVGDIICFFFDLVSWMARSLWCFERKH
jgi:hypothetical protein